MLELLHIENIAIIEAADIAFEPGFNALTGETGAGKSIVIDSLSAVLGQRTSRELIRTGADKAFVGATFSGVDADLTAALGIEPEADGTLLLQREIHGDGKNVCRVNGRPVTVGQLKALGARLLNIHGQHDGQQLLDEEQHIVYLDNFGKVESLMETYGVKYKHFTDIRRQISALQMDEAEKARRVDTLQYQIEDTRPAIVLDDVSNADLRTVAAKTASGVKAVVKVTNHYKRHVGNEYVPDEPYFTTTCENVKLGLLSCEQVTVDTPAPGTPADSCYADIRLPIPENGYQFAEKAEDYPLPLTVHRPYFSYIGDQTVKLGETLTLKISARNPANGLRTTQKQPEAVIEALDGGLTYGAERLPAGASFDSASHTLTFTPAKAGTYPITFTLDDGVIPEKKTIRIVVA